MRRIKLPPEGMFFGSGVYPSEADTLLCTMLGHYAWQPEHFSPQEMIDRIISENQGNTAQVWGYSRGFSPRVVAQWLYALDEIGVDVPAPDWDSFTNLIKEDQAALFEKYRERFGAGLLRFLLEAKKRGLYTTFLYTDSREEWIRRMAEEEEYYLGYDFGERFTFGLNDKKVLAELGPAPTLSQLSERFIGQVAAHTSERRAQGWKIIQATSSNFYLDYEVLGGVDIPLVEDFAFPSLNFSSGLSRGLLRQHDLPLWGSHVAHEHYSWLPNSGSYRYEQLRAALYLKYMAGAKMIINESGNWFAEHTLSPDAPRLSMPHTAREKYGVLHWGGVNRILKDNPADFKPVLEEARQYFPQMDYASPVCRQYRAVLSDFWDFVKQNGTPSGQPETTIALAKGNEDLCSARFQPNYAIGGLYDLAEENPAWFQCAPERGWKIARDVFFPELPVVAPHVNIHLSGTPYGQADVVSFAKNKITADFLIRNYKALLFTGWNTSSEAQYETLLAYVAAGGTLFISLPQLSMNETRRLHARRDELVRGGDFSDLCGLRVRGRGANVYWGIAHPRSQRLGLRFPRRFGIMGVPLGDVEITDPALEVLVADDENETPILTLHRHGKGRCYFLNTITYPGAIEQDEGPGSLMGSGGLVGYVCRHIANESRGWVYITDDGKQPGAESKYIAYSYFPEAGKICLYNIDFQQPHTVYLHQFGLYERMELAPAEFRVIETRKNDGRKP